MKKSTTLKTLAALATFAVLPIQATEVKVNIENLAPPLFYWLT